MSDTLTQPTPAHGSKPAWACDLPDTTEDGDPIVYGPRPLAPRIERVEPLDGYLLRVTFATGEVRRFDCTPLLDRGVFRPLRDAVAFRRVQPINDGGGIGWASGADLSRDTVYAAGTPA
ncbi:MAG: DUF2442 domain-containing protein [Bacteroidota bacterium]